MSKKIIGVIGTISSGKDTVAEYICLTRKIKNFSFSDEIRQEATARGLSNARANLFNLANELRSNYGPDELARRVVNRIREDLAIVTSIRYPGELQFMRENSDFTLISVDAPIELRFQRSRERGRLGDGNTFEQFKSAEDNELRGGDPNLQFIRVMRAADYFIINDGTLEKLHNRVDEIVRAILLIVS
ncbi:MAG: hypothetical protein HY225_00440 [Candidatus Vogelbacteria bacterium]|nr:hypothetical protein [Candidatus Vogelbacteria bacterium]